MRIIVYGATGGLGQEVIAEGLAAGHTMTAFVRGPNARLPEHPRLRVVHGDALQAHTVTQAIRDHDAVVSALGVKTSRALRSPSTTISAATRNIVNAMQQHHVPRLLFVSSFGVHQNVFWPEKLLLHTLLKNLFQDIPAQEALIRGSTLDWTIIRPARLTSGPKTGTYRANEHLNINPLSHISRSDVADYIISSIAKPETAHRTPVLSY